MSIEDVIKKAAKEFGQDTVRRGSETIKTGFISTGIPTLDYAMGIGGYPLGGITMIFGPESVGKSVLTYLAIGEVHRQGKYAALVDLEGSFDPEWAAHFGVDADKLIISTPESAEDTKDQAVFFAGEKVITLTVVDSLGAMASEKELDEDGKKQAYGQAGIITQMVKQILSRIKYTDRMSLLINQARDTANTRGLPMVHPPGGRALRHSCGMIIQLKAGRDKYTAKVPGETEPVEVGFRPIATITKNKLAPPKRTAEWDLYHTESDLHEVGIDLVGSTIDVALRKGIVERSGAWYSIFEERFQGKPAMIDWFKENPDKLDELRELLFTDEE